MYPLTSSQARHFGRNQEDIRPEHIRFLKHKYLNNGFLYSTDTEAEFKELKLYSMFQDLSRCPIETGYFDGFETRLNFIKLGLWGQNYCEDIVTYELLILISNMSTYKCKDQCLIPSSCILCWVWLEFEEELD